MIADFGRSRRTASLNDRTQIVKYKCEPSFNIKIGRMSDIQVLWFLKIIHNAMQYYNLSCYVEKNHPYTTSNIISIYLSWLKLFGFFRLWGTELYEIVTNHLTGIWMCSVTITIAFTHLYYHQYLIIKKLI